MNEQMLQMILEVVKTGGNNAMYIIIAYYLKSFVTTLLCFSFVGVVVTCIYKLVKRCIKLDNMDYNEKQEYIKSW